MIKKIRKYLNTITEDYWYDKNIRDTALKLWSRVISDLYSSKTYLEDINIENGITHKPYQDDLGNDINIGFNLCHGKKENDIKEMFNDTLYIFIQFLPLEYGDFIKIQKKGCKINGTKIVYPIKEGIAIQQKCPQGDAVDFNYHQYFKENNFPKQIDFLQIDIDNGFDEKGCAYNTTVKALLTLIGIPLNHYRFSIIAFEHETLMNIKNSAIRDAQREILLGLGYVLVKRWSYEDWWVDPRIVPRELYQSEFQQIAV
jgi:hypothetical protein